MTLSHSGKKNYEIIIFGPVLISFPRSSILIPVSRLTWENATSFPVTLCTGCTYKHAFSSVKN